jgi:hypothetical protein
LNGRGNAKSSDSRHIEPDSGLRSARYCQTRHRDPIGETSDARRPDPYSNSVSRNRGSLFPGNQILRPEKEGAKIAMSITPLAETLIVSDVVGWSDSNRFPQKSGCSFESDQLPG